MNRADRANGGFERRVQSFLMSGLLLLLVAVGAKAVYIGEAIATLQAQSVSTAMIIAELKADVQLLRVQVSGAALAANTAATAATTAAALAATAATTAAALAAQSSARDATKARRD